MVSSYALVTNVNQKVLKMNGPSVFHCPVPRKSIISDRIPVTLAQNLPAGSSGSSSRMRYRTTERRDSGTTAAEHACLRLVDDLGRSVPMGLNTAVRAARGTIIVRIDAHTQYAPDYVNQCLAVLQETGADNVGGPWVAQGTGYIGRAVAAAFQSPFAVGGARGHNQHYTGLVDTVYLGCWPREVFERIGVTITKRGSK
jgi:hypothetical protein